jgi:MipA family protein
MVMVAAAVASSTSFAQGRPPADGWQYSLGAGVVGGQKSIGSDQTSYLAVPSIDVRYKDWFFFNPIEGIGVQARTEGATASIALAPDLNSRDPDAGQRFRGLSRVSPTPAVRLKLAYEINDFTLSSVVSWRLSNESRRGTTLELEGGYNILASRNVTLNAGVTARYMDTAFAKNLLSVSSEDSARSGLPVYRARSGLLDAGLYGQVVYRIDDGWSVFSRVQVARLQSDAATSPFIEKRTEPGFVLFVNYDFGP